MADLLVGFNEPSDAELSAHFDAAAPQRGSQSALRNISLPTVDTDEVTARSASRNSVTRTGTAGRRQLALRRFHTNRNYPLTDGQSRSLLSSTIAGSRHPTTPMWSSRTGDVSDSAPNMMANWERARYFLATPQIPQVNNPAWADKMLRTARVPMWRPRRLRRGRRGRLVRQRPGTDQRKRQATSSMGHYFLRLTSMCELP